jgi:spore germination protein KC
MRLRRKLGILLSFFVFAGLFSGCYDRREVDDLSYVIAIGFDKGTVNPLRMTIQYAIPLAIGGGGGGDGGGSGGGGESKSTGLVTVEAPTLYSGLNMLNNFIGKQLYLSHAKVAVFSEELARNGDMHDYLHAMVRGREFRPNMNIVVSRGSAENYITSIKPVQEADPAKYYELKFSTYTYTGFTANTELSSFYNFQESTSKQPVATLVGVGNYEASKDIDPAKSTAAEKGRDKPLMGDYRAGEIPKAGDIKGETLGLAVFDGSKMTGELDGQESTMFLMATGQFDHAFLTFPDPGSKDSHVVVNLKQSRMPKYKIEFVDGKPQISLSIKLEGDFLSIQSGINYEEGPKLIEFEDSSEQFIKNEILRLLNRTAKELHSDIFGFGRFEKANFLTWNEWKDFDWLKKYRDASFNVEVDLKIRRTGLMIRSMPAVSSDGEEE